MFVKSTVAVALLVRFVGAQTMANSTIDPSQVDATLRSQWCQGQTNTCGTLCSGDLANNNCDPTTLEYTCTCAANNSAPGLVYYKETMPTFICEKIFDNCIIAGENSQAAQELCKTNEKNNCGHLDPENFTAAAPTSTSSVSATGTGTSASATSKSSAAAAPTSAPARNHGTYAMAAGVAAVFGFML